MANTPTSDVRLDALERALPGVAQIRVLNSGTFKDVFHAAFKDGHEEAIKLFKPHDPSQPGSIHLRNQREIEILSKIDHPRIASIVREVGELKIEGSNYNYYGEEFVVNGTLVDLHLPVDIDKVRRIFLDVLSALKVVGKYNLVHRDLKPGNIGLDEEGRAVVFDFGAVLDPRAETLTEVGGVAPRTLRYAAPEQNVPRRADTVDARADQYALGLVVRELATGRLDGQGWPDDSGPLVPVTERMTKYRQNMRYRLISDILADLEAE